MVEHDVEGDVEHDVEGDVEHVAERGSQKPSLRRVLLVGAGQRARAVGAALTALSALDAEGERSVEPCLEFQLADLEELLTQRSLEGLLILESGHVPGEDIGFVRRFLERHPAWRVAVVGAEAGGPAVQRLLSLVRAQWVSWPPDLEELRALLGPELSPAAAGTAQAAAPRSAPAGGERVGARRPERRTTPSLGAVDLGELLEELLASAALRGEGAPRFQFTAGARVRVQRERAALRAGLDGLVELARVCAGGDGLVSASLAPSGDSVVVRLEFPRAALSETGLDALLEHAPALLEAPPLEAPLAEGLAAARRGVEFLRTVGGRVQLASAGKGRLRCEVLLAAAPQPETPAQKPVRPHAPTRPEGQARPVRAGKPEDPFA
mgnify:CR=1 FL=1